MIKDDLGKRMKENYEMRARTYLTRRMPTIIRLDGCHFHTFTKGFKRPFDKLFNRTMQATTKFLCENVQGCVLAYTQSDEISLLLVDYKDFASDAWYDGQVQKICSVSAALATYAFNKFFNEFYLEQLAEKGEVDSYDLVYDKKRKGGAWFDARCFNIPRAEVVNYFYWRQVDAERNSANSLAQSLFSHKSLQGLNLRDTIAKCEIEGGVIWGELPTVQKRGCCVKRNGEGKWEVDLDIPRFNLDREYIAKRALIKEDLE